MTAEPGPWRVVLADLDAPLPTVDATRPRGGRYERALCFLTRGGALVGQVEVGLDPPVPLADAVAGLTFPEPSRPAGVPDSALPFATVVVATTMVRVSELDRCLSALLRLEYPAFEVVLVDNRPSTSPERASLYEALCRDARVRVVAEPRPGISAARNHGARLARGEVVAFTDDDVVVDPGWLRAVASRFVAEPDTSCVTGPVLPAELETPAQLWFEQSGSKLPNRCEVTTLRGPARSAGLGRRAFEADVLVPGRPTERAFIYRAGTFGMGANMAWRRPALARLRGFSEALGIGTATMGGEDIDSMMRLLRSGGQFTFDPAAIVHHYHRRDLEGSRTQMYGYGTGFTAVVTSWVLADPRHLAGLAYQLAPALRVLARRSGSRRSGDYPAELATQETRGMRAGPLAYLRSRRAARRNGAGHAADWSHDAVGTAP